MPTRTMSSAKAKAKAKTAKKAAPKQRAVKHVATPTPPAPPPPPPPTDLDGGDVHVQRAMEYMRGVLSGVIPACLYVRQACKRQMADLERYKDHPLYYWDPDMAGRVCRYIERMPHVKGPKAKAGELIVLEPWQCFILTTVFGWYRKDTKGRRYRRVYIEVPRGNAKSTLSSAVGNYCLTSDGEEGAEVYSAATKRDQAKIVQGDAAQMFRKRPDFAGKLGVVVNQHNILHPKTNSKFEPLSRDSDTMDGLNVHLAIIDELHAHKDRGVYDVIETGMGKRHSSMVWIITTAGSDTSGICYEVRGYVIKVLAAVDAPPDQNIVDESQFGIIYTIDEGDDWTDPSVWIKANPNWGVSVYAEAFGQLATKAMQVLSAQSNFKTKHLNVWVNADMPWMDLRYWDRMADPTLTEAQVEREAECHMGLDLATKTDIVAKVNLYVKHLPVPDDEAELCDRCRLLPSEHVAGEGSKACPEWKEPPRARPHWYAFLHAYLPESAVIDGRNASYEGWVTGGFLHQTPGDVIDFATIKQDIFADAARVSLIGVSYDPWQATQLAQELSETGIETIEVRATTANFSAPMKEVDAMVRQQRFHHDGNPVFRWMVSNVVCHFDAKDNIYPNKEKPENKIDGVVALIMAAGRAMFAGDNPYETRGVRTL